MLKNIKNKRDGFTLIELMIVIGIMATLAGIVFPQLTGMQNKAKDTGIIAAAGSIRTAMKVYYIENENEYPDSSEFDTGKDAWENLNDFLETIDLGDRNDYNIQDISYNVSSDGEMYLIEFESKSDSNKTYYLGEKSFSEDSNEASEI